MRRRELLKYAAYSAIALTPVVLIPRLSKASSTNSNTNGESIMNDKTFNLAPHPSSIEHFELTKKQWKERLSPEQFRILRKHGTERSFTSDLNDERSEGEYACAGCGLVLFKSEHKFDSGTGWPSFFDAIEGRIGTSTDYKLLYPRTEYHCARCKGHHGHVFKDGPQPTGLRYCNNGVALTFNPKN